MNEPVYAVPFTFESMDRLLFILDEAHVNLELNRETEAFLDRLRTRLHLILNPVVR